ncbi:MAG: AAA family ATPase [Methanolobus sp.]|uniref:Cdc6/Cdc18 family protein n=1 Tax=Methanolobus sp. TaxID=1874737 RepID=UPI002731A1BB|nr:AAA family ATPase [Methanolobus sp.]MDP2217185.1 AAA family ATPase [Methanolobus sp.]
MIKDASVFTNSYFPTTIRHREKQIKDLEYQILGPLTQKLMRNSIIYGVAGTGKTLTVRYVADQLKTSKNVQVWYIKLREARTEYSAINTVGKALGLGDQKGHTDTKIYSSIYEYILKMSQKHFLFILDEVQNIKQDCNSFLDFFLRPEENCNLGEKKISVVFISNKITYPQNLDAGMQSSFACIDKLIFPPYNANQLRDILNERTAAGLYENTYESTVIPLCAAYAAQEHGDARRAIQMLGIAAAIAEKESAQKITEEHIKKARETIEFEGAANIIRTLPGQGKAVVLAIARDIKARKKKGDTELPTTGTIYIQYNNIVTIIGIDKLTQRRVTDILIEFEEMGLVSTALIFKGRMGRWKTVDLNYPVEIIEKAVTEDVRFEEFKPIIIQSKL